MNPTTADDATQTPFHTAIREATWGAHGDAEGATYLGDLTSGKLDLRRYADMVAQHHFAYEALEAFNDAWRDDPAAGPFVDDRLDRGPALVADLKALLGSGWRDEVEPNPATVAYVARLNEVGASWAGGWVAHHYVRYLGDLSGGQMIRGTIEEIYGIDATNGTAFYDFSSIPDHQAFKEAYRANLDHAPWDEAERAKIIEEILLGYHHNTQVLVDLS